ncbi:NnrU family protein [Sabulicella rubraurantiaca]|uniref:NnrU family protein n=1 Tax=Sabulicella rubraurantiaca TaxID=2811429 RepID=UPI001A97A8A3|nr:NnrU family protein [Sabulicella rubraurantiaca]
MLALLLAALLWVGLHVGVAGTGLRAAFVARLGERGFRAAFSLASAVAITLLVLAWRNAPFIPLWALPEAGRLLVAALMLPAFLLFAASVATPNPTAVGGALAGEPRGIQRITRHPMLWSFALWAGLHALADGTAAGMAFFGAFLVTALAGMPSIDAKLRRRDPALWARLAAVTSILPLGAVLSGRNRAAWREIPLRAWAGGLAGWALLLWLHPHIFGVPALLP